MLASKKLIRKRIIHSTRADRSLRASFKIQETLTLSLTLNPSKINEISACHALVYLFVIRALFVLAMGFQT